MVYPVPIDNRFNTRPDHDEEEGYWNQTCNRTETGRVCAPARPLHYAHPFNDPGRDRSGNHSRQLSTSVANPTCIFGFSGVMIISLSSKRTLSPPLCTWCLIFFCGRLCAGR